MLRLVRRRQGLIQMAETRVATIMLRWIGQGGLIQGGTNGGRSHWRRPGRRPFQQALQSGIVLHTVEICVSRVVGSASLHRRGLTDWHKTAVLAGGRTLRMLLIAGGSVLSVIPACYVFLRSSRRLLAIVSLRVLSRVLSLVVRRRFAILRLSP
jgi:hypothetical protein